MGAFATTTKGVAVETKISRVDHTGGDYNPCANWLVSPGNSNGACHCLHGSRLCAL